MFDPRSRFRPAAFPALLSVLVVGTLLSGLEQGGTTTTTTTTLAWAFPTPNAAGRSGTGTGTMANRLGGMGLHGRAPIQYPTPHETTTTTTRSSLFNSVVTSTPNPSSPSSKNAEAGGDGGDGEVEKTDFLICGGGPAGLLTAIMLSRKFPDRRVKLCDRLSRPPSPDDETVWGDVAKFYLIGLGGRGQTALKKYGVWEEVRDRSVAVVGRKDWPPGSAEGVERIFTEKDKRVTTVVLPRDKLVGVLHEHIANNYADRIELNYGYEVRPVDFDHAGGSEILVTVSKCEESVARLNPSSVKTAAEEQREVMCATDSATFVSADLLLAADGTVRTIANSMERRDARRMDSMNPVRRMFAGRPFRVRRYEDDNQRVYKTVPMKVPSSWRYDLNYSARTKEGRVTYDALPANGRGEYCAALLLRKGDPMAAADTDPSDLRRLMDDALPQFSALLDDDAVAAVAKKPVSYLPAFRYAGPRLHQGNSCVILGDCAHTVKPYFGLGANSALEDVVVLDDVLDSVDGDLPRAVREFSRRRAADSRALVRISRDLDRPGKLGFLTFILPLILDSIFNGIMPKIFEANVIAMLQKETVTFRQVARRKRLDRAGQLGIIAASLSCAGYAGCKFVGSLVSDAGATRIVSAAGLIGFAGGIAGARAISSVAGPQSAPADVLAKLSRRVTNSRTHLTPLRKIGKNNNRGEVNNGESFLTPLGFKNADKET